jgi:uncharacterized membrane protein
LISSSIPLYQVFSALAVRIGIAARVYEAALDIHAICIVHEDRVAALIIKYASDHERTRILQAHGAILARLRARPFSFLSLQGVAITPALVSTLMGALIPLTIYVTQYLYSNASICTIGPAC